MSDFQPESTALSSLLAAERELLRDQLSAAWQIHVDQVMERLESGWREHIEAALSRRFEELSLRLSRDVEEISAREVAERLPRAERLARRRLTSDLSQVARRLAQSADTTSWAAAVLDGLQGYATHAVFLEVAGGHYRFREQRGWQAERTQGVSQWQAPAPGPAALASVHESLDTVIGQSGGAEFPEPWAGWFNSAGFARICATPRVVGRFSGKPRVAAVLLSAGPEDGFDAAGVELVATMAASALEGRIGTGSASGTGLLAIASGAPTSPFAEGRSAEVEEAHARAQRFARVRVAEIRLYRADQVRDGRVNRDLYSLLRDDIDRGREDFRAEFGAIDSMKDYFHQEVLRTLAHNDAALLGPDYPGPLL